MSKHTPAPWIAWMDVVEVDGENYTIVNILPKLESGYRGSICRIQSAENIGGIGAEEAEANGKLILHAPDMLDFLNDMVGALDALLKEIPMEDGAGNDVAAFGTCKALLSDCEAMVAKVGAK